MAEHNDLGKMGEEMAVRHLTRNSCLVLERNWRFRRLEIDIIARSESELIIAEVKTRRADFLEPPAESVNKRKQKLLIRAANAYVSISKLDLDVRFDIVTVIFTDKTNFSICHIKNAFYPQVH
ncbi:MAG: YraN family protein [Bacteroidales bacterium]